LDYRDSPDADKNALRHYSFDKGLLEGLVPLDSISKSRDAALNVNSVGRSFLRCGKDRVSIFFGAAAQYIEVDASNGKLARWNVAIPPIEGGKATGFAVTEAGRSFVNLLSFSEPDNTVRVIGNLKSMDEYGVNRDLGHNIFLFVDRASRAT
jgi:hypothetical protein